MAKSKKKSKNKKGAGTGSKWTWFIFTILFGAIPVIVSLCVASNRDNIGTFYKVEDFCYWGITMCVSNFTLVGGKEVDGEKTRIIGLSIFCVMLLGVFIGVIQTAQEIKPLFNWIILFVVAGTVFLSNRANNYVFDT